MGLILVVSEDLEEIETIKAALSVHGWWVTVAADRQTALQVAADQAPKLVVVDSDLTDSLDLVSAFGSCNGGPGVLSCVPQGFDRTLEFKEAGGDEMLTKPVDPASVLEAVQRCLAAPRAEAVERAEPSTLLTTEEIFGDVLREIELGDEAVAAAPTPAPQVEPDPPPAPSPEPAPRAEPVVFEPEPVAKPAKPMVSLAGLFDEGDEPEPIPPPPASDSRPSDDEWRGEERRSADRPWSGKAPEPPAEAEVLHAPSLSSAGAERLTADLDWIEELEEDAEQREAAAPESTAEVTARPFPKAAVAIGSLAAALLVAVGVLVFLNRGGEPEAGAPAEPPAVEREGAPPVEAPAIVATEAAEPPAPANESAPAEAETLAASEVAGETGELEDFDLEAIVDQELERREEELRRVFLEEEKRLLRELNNLEPEEPPADGGEDGGQDRSGVGR